MADYEEEVRKALAEGRSIPPFPDMSPLAGLAMAQHEAVTEWVKAGFSRGEALYMVAASFCGNPGASPAAGAANEGE
jgi:hypothetical protein